MTQDRTGDPASRVLLTCDTGEAADGGGRAREAALLAHVDAISVACGGHAGDDATMHAMALAARDAGLTLGAHPSYPDRAGFGRRRIAMSAPDLAAAIASQLNALRAACAQAGVGIAFVKPHGALYHDVCGDPARAMAFADACRGVLGTVPLVGLAGSPALEAWRAAGHDPLPEGFADRTYEPDGSLRSRSLPGAVIDDPQAAAAQALRLARSGTVRMLCVHADSPGAPAIAEAVSRALRAAGSGDAGHA